MSMSDKIFGTYTENNRKRIKSIVDKTNSYRKTISNITHSQNKIKVKLSVPVNKETVMTEEEYAFYKKTNEFRERLRNGESVHDIMPEALAVCREATFRKLGMFHYDVQVEAAASMQDNIIAEMKTGEGKSLVQILCAYLNVLDATKSLNPNEWKSVHIITANEYLAERDQKDNASVYSLLGLSSGYAYSQDACRKNKRMQDEKRKSYSSDIVYGTAKTIAFDYLDDNHAYDKSEKFITKKPYYAIVDEADDILLDQATRPLILSSNVNTHDVTKVNGIDIYEWATRFINGEPGFRNKPVTCHKFNQFNQNKSDGYTEDCALYLDQGNVYLSDALYAEIYGDAIESNNPVLEKLAFLKVQAITNCLLAREFYLEGKQYQVLKDENESIKNGKEDVMKVVLTDSFTGRSMEQTKYQNGIQEAIEASVAYNLEKSQRGKTFTPSSKKKILKFSDIYIPIAKCTYPDFLSIYENGVSGMTGTSDIEEFSNIYHMETYEVPSRRKNIRIDEEDELYLTEKAKHRAILKEILECQKTKQPILIGTINVEESNKICKMLEAYGIRFQRLDAINKNNEDGIKKTAGLLGTVTVATNMAGRGIDIKLGPGVEEVGGLYVIGTSKNKAKRIDNQLKGRAARQGDPGKTKYYMSLDDELIKTGSFKLEFFKQMITDKFAKITNKRIISVANKGQLNEEGYQNQVRMQSEYVQGKVYTPQKNIIYEQREKVLNASPTELRDMICNIIENDVSNFFKNNPSLNEVKNHFGNLVNVTECYSEDNKIFEKNILKKIMTRLKYAGAKDPLKYLQSTKIKMLKIIDDYWINHINTLDDVWKNATYYSYSNVNPIEIYEKEAYLLFQQMNECIKNEIINYAVDPTMSYGEYKLPDNFEMGENISR